MADKSKIEWTDATWNPFVGCQVKSPGCTNCYAMRSVAPRLANNPATPHYHGTVKKVNGKYVWTGKIGIASDEVFLKPLRWRRSRHIFVNSTSDLFHPNVPDEVRDRVFAIMALCPQHEFQILTKHPERAVEYLGVLLGNNTVGRCGRQGRFLYAARTMAPLPSPFTMQIVCPLLHEGAEEQLLLEHYRLQKARDHARAWPLPNVLIGTSVERQQEADERRPHLARIAEMGWRTFVSYEPALGHVDWTGWEFIVWLISGGESGADARPSHPDWHRAARDFCAANNIPYHFKQWGEWVPGEFGQPPDAFFQNGTWMDANLFPDWDDPETKKIWDDGMDFDVELTQAFFKKVGKKASGRLLDGIEHNGMPE